MEEKLFWVGIIMGLHLFLTHHFKDKRKFNAKFLRWWHSFFAFLFFFVAGLMVAVSLDNNSGIVVTADLFSRKQLVYGFLSGLVAGIYTYFSSGRKNLKSEKERNKILKHDIEWSETIFSAVILASIVMYVFLQAFKIPSGSMRMTFLEGDHLFVNKIIYGIRIPYTKKKILKFKKIKRGDIVIFRFPSNSPNEFQCGGHQYGKDFIKRVIGIEGDEIEVKEGRLYVNGKLVLEDYAQYVDGFNRIPPANIKIPWTKYQWYWQKREIGKMLGEYVRDNFGPVKVPKNSYFVMGDNRDRSCDSRYWGPVPEYLIKGKAWFIYWPPKRMQVSK